jgi:hypothetical protein
MLIYTAELILSIKLCSTYNQVVNRTTLSWMAICLRKEFMSFTRRMSPRYRLNKSKRINYPRWDYQDFEFSRQVQTDVWCRNLPRVGEQSLWFSLSTLKLSRQRQCHSKLDHHQQPIDKWQLQISKSFALGYRTMALSVMAWLLVTVCKLDPLA